MPDLSSVLPHSSNQVIEDSEVFVDEQPNGKADNGSTQEASQNGHSEAANGHSGDPDGAKPLREREDIEDIAASISPTTSTKLHNIEAKKVPSNVGEESPKVVGNPWSFFNRFGDKRESRYKHENEEQQDNTPYSPVSNDVPNFGEESPRTQRSQGNFDPNDEFEDYDGEPSALFDEEGDEIQPGQGLASFFPSKYSSSSIPRRNQDPSSPGKEDSSRHPKLRKRLNVFRSRKKDRSKKQSISGIDFDNEMDKDVDADTATGQRAQTLVGRLAISADAIGLLASCLLEDERGIGRAPLLLTLLGFKITDISPRIGTKIRRFRLDLEYGVGPSRLQWSVEKNAKDLLYLHSRFKVEKWRNEVRSIKTDLPKYPIPPLRSIEGGNKAKAQNRLSKAGFGLGVANANANVNGGQEESRLDVPQEDNGSIHSNHTLRAHLANFRSSISAISSIASDDQNPEYVRAKTQKNQEYIREVAKYLNDLIALIALKPQSNKLFQFFEISPISSLLSYETGFTGKQGVIHLGGTAKSQGWRVGHFKANDLKGMIDRRSEKWLLVRNSYVMYVSEINSTLPLDVFLVDHKFRIVFKQRDNLNQDKLEDEEDSDYDDSSMIQMKLGEETLENSSSHKNVFQHLKITLENSERKMVLIPKSVKEQRLWLKSLMEMKNSTVYANSNRFNSFAPVRKNCFAQWFVDGRDYFWAVSSALEMAKDVIYIHDWWLSPELYLRRPANGNQQWRIDRILQRKAQQGVKIYVIVYRNVGSTVSTDSLYTKHSILSLNEENIHVIRSPNQLLQNTYFWAHHEKLCIVDHTAAFVGGIDLCFGRYDTPDHVLTDDSKLNFDSLEPEDRLSPEEFSRFQIFPGKDYSNPRVKDFYGLDKPYESMYDRDSVPRMPWHDVHMLTSGKVARDLARHFVQRWNYLIRQKRPSRFTPLLTPPSALTDEEVERMGLGGTCEVQLVRSSGNWSLGLKEHEQSIQNAYLKLIETSEHFVYMENQFFVTSCFIDGTEIKNRIGDALVDRIIKAYNEGTNWKAIIVIPLMPGFESQVDEPDGSSVRVIMQCQYMSISRGTSSIFAKLRKYGIEPDDYIQFFSLRKWGRIGPDRTLVTEQLYIHAKTMIVDDRVALIGSANINERSMRGVRDSEVCAIVRDEAMISTTMDGAPYLAGKYAHTLRMRLMREHLGVNVDILEIVERRFKKFENFANTPEGLKAATNRFKKKENQVLSAMVEIASRDILSAKEGTFRWKNFKDSLSSNGGEASNFSFELDEEAKLDEKKIPPPLSLPVSFNNRTGTHEANKGIRDKKKHSYDARVQHNDKHKQDVFGDGIDKYKSKLAKRARLNSGRFLKDLAKKSMKENPTASFLPDFENVREFLEADDFDIIDEIDEESEELISDRNKERWALLKKISYLQRVAAKEKDDKDEESKKRVDAGMSATICTPTASAPSNAPASSSTGGVSSPEPEGVTIDVPNNGAPQPQFSTVDDHNNSLSDKQKAEENIHSEHIPIVSLDEQATREVLQSINPKGSEHFSKYVDPYGFEDPLHYEFYEDLWYEHARRNTEVFRLIFHTQPDDCVLSWKDYKQHSKLQRAFMIAQQQEAKRNRSKKHRDHSYEETESSSEDDSSIGEGITIGRDKRNSHATINVNKLDQDVGLLGHAPPSRDGTGVIPEISSPSTSKHRFRRHNSTQVNRPEQIHEEVSDLETIDQENEDDTEEAEENENDETPLLNGKSPNLPSKSSEGTFQNGLKSGFTASTADLNNSKDTRKKRSFSTRRRMHRGERIFERDSAERILNEIQGHLVLFPVDWLSRELEGGNWFYNTDRIPPIDIYD